MASAGQARKRDNLQLWESFAFFGRLTQAGQITLLPCRHFLIITTSPQINPCARKVFRFFGFFCFYLL